MVLLFYIIIFLLVLWLAAGIYLIIRFLIKKRFIVATLSFIITFTPVLGICYITNLLIDYLGKPTVVPDSEVQTLFTRMTGQPLPASAIIVEREGANSLYDRYVSAIIRMDTVDFNNTYAIIATDNIYDIFSSDTMFRRISGDTIWTPYTERLKLLQKAQISNIGFEKYKLGYKEIGFSNDNQHIIIKYED